MVCVLSEKYAIWVTLRPQSDCYRRWEAKVDILNFETTWLEFQKASQTATEGGKAKLHLLNSKTTWSEFQKASQTATVQGKAQLRILNLKTTWVEFQKPSQTAAMRGKAKLRILNFKTTWSEFQKPNQTKPSCVYLILKSHGQPGYTYTILNKITSPESIPSSCVRQHT